MSYDNSYNTESSSGSIVFWIIGVVICVIIRVLIYRCIYGSERSFDYFKFFRLGNSYYNERKLSDALSCFQTCLESTTEPSKRRDCNIMIGTIYFETSEYDKAIRYLSEAINGNEKDSAQCYLIRSSCYEKNREYEKAVQDIFLADEFRVNKRDDNANRTFREKTEKVLTDFAVYKRDLYLKNNSLSPSSSKCSDFFKTFVCIMPKEEGEAGDIAYLIKNEDFETLYTIIFGQQSIYAKKKFEKTYGTDTLFTFDLILCAVHFLCGNTVECARILSSPKNDLEYVFSSYIESTKPGYKPKNDLLVRLSNIVKSDNPTVKFWSAKVYRELGNISAYFDLMNCMKNTHSFVMADLLEYFTSTNDPRKFKELEKEALDIFGSDISVIYRIWSYYFTKRDKERLRVLDDTIGTGDARSLYMKGRYRGIINDNDLRDKYLNDALLIDSAYFEIFFYLAVINRFTDFKKYKSYMEKAIKAASSRNELLDCYKDLLSMEAKNFVKKQVERLI